MPAKSSVQAYDVMHCSDNSFDLAWCVAKWTAAFENAIPTHWHNLAAHPRMYPQTCRQIDNQGYGQGRLPIFERLPILHAAANTMVLHKFG
jgi:hypothetical protein